MRVCLSEANKMRKIMGRKSRGTERELRRTDDEEEHKKEGFTKGGVTFY